MQSETYFSLRTLGICVVEFELRAKLRNDDYLSVPLLQRLLQASPHLCRPSFQSSDALFWSEHSESRRGQHSWLAFQAIVFKGLGAPQGIHRAGMGEDVPTMGFELLEQSSGKQENYVSIYLSYMCVCTHTFKKE